MFYLKIILTTFSACDTSCLVMLCDENCVMVYILTQLAKKQLSNKQHDLIFVTHRHLSLTNLNPLIKHARKISSSKKQ